MKNAKAYYAGLMFSAALFFTKGVFFLIPPGQVPMWKPILLVCLGLVIVAIAFRIKRKYGVR